MEIRKWLALGLAVLSCAGCGGGGGSSSSGSSSSPVNSPIDSVTPTFKFLDDFDESARYQSIAIEAVDSGPRLLNYAQFAVDIAHRFAAAGSPASVAANCAYTGRITLQFDDRDANGRASAGDVITAVLDTCGVPALGRTASGTLRLDIEATTPSADQSLRARITVSDSLRTGALNGPSIWPGSMRGTFVVHWSEAATGSQLRATSTSENDLRFTNSESGKELGNALREVDVSRVVRYDTASISSSMSFALDVGDRGGVLRVKSPESFQGDLNVLPKRFRVDAEIDGGRILRVERDQSASGVPLVAVRLLDSRGSSTRSSYAAWGAFVSAMKDVRTATPVYTASDQGGGFVVLAPWRKARFGLEIDRACQQGARAGVSNYRADALFQRPVAAGPGLTEADATLTIQFGRAIADNTPELRFRMADTETIFNAGSPPWHVAATAVRRGSSYEIRLAEPLRYGRNYALQSSYDGIDWSGDRIIRDSQNQVVNTGGSAFTYVDTDNVLEVQTAMSDLGTVATNAPARLRADVRLRDGQTVSRYRWEQISGVPLRLSTPSASETDAVLEAGTALPIGDAVMSLIVTDSLGNVDRARVVLKAGTVVAQGQGAALYVESGAGTNPPWRSLATGTGSIFYGTVPGSVSPRLPGLKEGGTGVSFTVTPANGQRLAVGSYTDAIMSEAPGHRNGLLTGLFCGGLQVPSVGSFKVLDVAYGGDGQITQLAIDFEQHCDGNWVASQRGSYRYNSTLPLTP